MLKTFLNLLFFFQVCFSLHAQDLTGTWEGSGAGTTITIVLVKYGNHYVGHTYDRDGMGFCKTNLDANFDSLTRKFKGKSMGFIDHGGLHSQSNYHLRYSVSGTREILRGSITAKSAAVKIMSLGIPIPGITLTKKSNYADTTAFMHAAIGRPTDTVTETTAAVPGNYANQSAGTNSDTVTQKDSVSIVAAGQNRSNLVMETFITSSATIQFKVYDNGVEDGDIISILYNDCVLKSHIPVTVKPASFELNLDEKFSTHDITVIAHNLGSIPPNTATIEMRAGEKMYIIRASAGMTNNAVIRLKYYKAEQ